MKTIARNLCLICLFIALNTVAASAQTVEDYLVLYGEALEYVGEYFAEPVDPEKRWISDDNFSGFGIKISPFTGTVRFSDNLPIACYVNTEVTSMTDGIITGYDGFDIRITFGDFEIEYRAIRIAPGLNPGGQVTKGQVIGHIRNGHNAVGGPGFRLAIRFKGVYLDPALFLVSLH